jgi:hypothetical protein
MPFINYGDGAMEKASGEMMKPLNTVYFGVSRIFHLRGSDCIRI